MDTNNIPSRKMHIHYLHNKKILLFESNKTKLSISIELHFETTKSRKYCNTAEHQGLGLVLIGSEGGRRG